MVEQLAVNQWVVGSSPTRGASQNDYEPKAPYQTVFLACILAFCPLVQGSEVKSSVIAVFRLLQNPQRLLEPFEQGLVYCLP